MRNQCHGYTAAEKYIIGADKLEQLMCTQINETCCRKSGSLQAFIYASIVPSWANQLLQQLVMEQSDTYAM